MRDVKGIICSNLFWPGWSASEIVEEIYYGVGEILWGKGTSIENRIRFEVSLRKTKNIYI